MVASALIGAGASLLGGLLGKKDKVASAYQQTREGIQAQAKYAREYGDIYGWNPLTLLGASQPMGAQNLGGGNNYMGAAVSDAGMILADALTKQKDVGRLERAERMNEHLRKQVTDLTLRPAVPGVYGAANGAGGGDAAVSDGVVPVGPAGVRAGSESADGSGPYLEPLRDTDPADPRRETDHKPVATHPGWMVIDNPTVGRMWFPTLDGDEALDVTQYPTAAYGWATRERGLGGRLIEGVKTGDWDWALRGPRTGEIQANLDYLGRHWKKVTKPKSAVPKKGLSDWFTDPLTGFTAKRYKP